MMFVFNFALSFKTLKSHVIHSVAISAICGYATFKFEDIFENNILKCLIRLNCNKAIQNRNSVYPDF